MIGASAGQCWCILVYRSFSTYHIERHHIMIPTFVFFFSAFISPLFTLFTMFYVWFVCLLSKGDAKLTQAQLQHIYLQFNNKSTWWTNNNKHKWWNIKGNASLREALLFLLLRYWQKPFSICYIVFSFSYGDSNFKFRSKNSLKKSWYTAIV